MKKMKEDYSLHMVEHPSVGGKIAHALVVAGVILVAFCSLVPLWHVVMASLSDGKTLLAHEGLLWKWVGDFTMDGYKRVFQDSSIMKGYLNTLIYVVGGTFFCMLINITGGYVLSQDFKLKNLFMVLVLLTSMFNGGLIPTYMVIRNLGWVGTRWALLIPGCTNAYFIIMMVTAFKRVPASTVEAARIDGAGHLQVMFRIMMPQAMGMGGVVILNSVLMQWNSWFNASIYVGTNRDSWPLQLWIKQIIADNVGFLQTKNPVYSRYLVQYGLIVVATLPILVVFPFFSNIMEKSVIVGAVKE